MRYESKNEPRNHGKSLVHLGLGLSKLENLNFPESMKFFCDLMNYWFIFPPSTTCPPPSSHSPPFASLLVLATAFTEEHPGQPLEAGCLCACPCLSADIQVHAQIGEGLAPRRAAKLLVPKMVVAVAGQGGQVIGTVGKGKGQALCFKTAQA